MQDYWRLGACLYEIILLISSSGARVRSQLPSEHPASAPGLSRKKFESYSEHNEILRAVDSNCTFSLIHWRISAKTIPLGFVLPYYAKANLDKPIKANKDPFTTSSVIAVLKSAR